MKKRIYILLSVLIIVSVASFFLIKKFFSEPTKINYVDNPDVKTFLIKKYNPGTCYGMPSTGLEFLIDIKIKNKPELVDYIKKTFNTEDKFVIYHKISQIHQIELIQKSYGYDFTIQNGQCCTIFTYEGKVKIKNDTMSSDITKTSIKNVPC
ncbi:MAG: hypothetical protein AUJ23_03040 [Candidatus Magasanikbacteria bacterium CG1_02_32_51]|uniref:Uncharacterized protein n=1 Tax=Candidatus Magasanikbacteria bacterium CG1_02_32_51 TaxID=1805238 RepID=A0A1J4U9B9_9BACT|nr:MAG: hypothetical protein AUJ23_03040 [Candidatus Magasanikbacteria bacterium CG1_02_32_51]